MMSGCREIELEIGAYCSGELEPGQRDLVRRHLDRCPACRGEMARELELRRALGTLPDTAAPPALQERILAATGATQVPLRRSGNAWRLAAAAAMAAACLAIALLVPGLRPDSEPEPTWSAAEIAAARQDVMYTLTLTARVIDRTRKDAVIDVFADKLPHAIDESFKMVKPTTSGGNG